MKCIPTELAILVSKYVLDADGLVINVKEVKKYLKNEEELVKLDHVSLVRFVIFFSRYSLQKRQIYTMTLP